MKVYLINSGQGEDYLADLVIIHFLLRVNCTLFANYIPDYLFYDYPNPDKLYGRGYTVFASVPRSKSQTVEILDINSILSAFTRDDDESYVIYTSVWRYNELLLDFQGVSSSNSFKHVIALDGEDHSRLHNSFSSGLNYYKRELVDNRNVNVHPISFCIPSFHLPFAVYGCDFVPRKTSILSPCDPRYRESYIFKTSSEYYRQYSSSLFGVTTKKGGWDCLRHYEIIACHSLPYFPDIELKPVTTMADYPVQLQLRANMLFQKIISSSLPICHSTIEEYKVILRGFCTFLYDRLYNSPYTALLSTRSTIS